MLFFRNNRLISRLTDCIAALFLTLNPHIKDLETEQSQFAFQGLFNRDSGRLYGSSVVKPRTCRLCAEFSLPFR